MEKPIIKKNGVEELEQLIRYAEHLTSHYRSAQEGNEARAKNGLLPLPGFEMISLKQDARFAWRDVYEMAMAVSHICDQKAANALNEILNLV